VPKVLHRGSPVKGAAFIATPCSGNINPEYTFALAQSCMELTRQGVPVEVEIYSENCHVDDGRNRLVRDFLDSDCDQLIFIDSDLRWEPKDLRKLIEHKQDVVAGIYPLKQNDEAYPVRLLGGPLFSNEDGLLEVEAVPTGFLKIRRNVLEELSYKAPRFPAKDDVKGKRMIPLIFERTHEGNVRWGGDYTFCVKWRKLGGRIFIDPNFRLEHYGNKCYSGTYGQFLKRKMGLGISELLNVLSKNEEKVDTIIDLVEQWGNPLFTASPEFLYICIKQARESKGDIVECGTGLTTLCMAVACPDKTIYSLDHDPIWASHISKEIEKYKIKNIKIIHAPIKDLWYDVKELPECELIVCDGPPRSNADRTLLKQKINKDIRIILDDYDDSKDWGDNITVFGASRLSAIVEYKVKDEKVLSHSPV
jgi:hypothetical protein